MTISLMQRFIDMDNKLINLLVFPLICIVFILLHTNQNSSQSMASFLLMLSPIVFLYPGARQVIEYKELRIMFALIFTYFLYNFLILTQHSFNPLSLSYYRALFFWLLLPFVLVFLFIKKPSIQSIALLFVFAAICSTYPIITDHINGGSRGDSSMHSIFWGNISLCSAMIAFTLRKSFNNRYLHLISYIALAFGLTASFWSLTRGGWVSIPLSLFCLFLCKGITKKHLAVFTALLILIITTVPKVSDRINVTFQSVNISWSGFSIALDNSTQVRLDMWETSAMLIKEHPIVGNGFSAYQDGVQKMLTDGVKLGGEKHYKMPHNEYIHILINGGLVSLTLLISILTILIKIFHGFISRSAFKTAGYLLVLQFCIFSMSEIFFSTKLPIVYFCIASALIIYAGLTEKTSYLKTMQQIKDKEVSKSSASSL
ncbi:MAG: O-antigen ligase family protein [Oleispira sp.]